MLKLAKIDYWIISFLFLLLIVDMFNGIVLHNNIVLPLSLSQLYKIFILLMLFARLSAHLNKLKIILLYLGFLLIPTLYQIIKQISLKFVLPDFIYVTKYLLPLFSFLFFSETFKHHTIQNHKRVFQLINFSYVVLVANIFIKYFGFGYPMYSYGDIGSKGFFYAGNELSVLLIILSSIIGYNLWLENKTKKYYLFLLLNVIAGIFLSSKTGILGILLAFFLIPLKPPSLKIKVKKLKLLVLSIFVVFPLVAAVSWKLIKDSNLYVRLRFFWEKLDVLTFVLSSRNKFAEKIYEIYKQHYDLVEKIIGVGQTKYEVLALNKTIEIDFLDIFFAYGFLGLFLFMISMIYVVWQSNRFRKKREKYKYASFVFLMSIIMLSISSIAGHVFNSGMAGVFLGLLFSLMYLKNYNNE